MLESKDLYKFRGWRIAGTYMESTLEFEDIGFEDAGELIRVNFLKNYYFEVGKSELLDIAPFRISGKKSSSIIFETNEKRARNKLNLVMLRGFASLKNRFTGRKTVYITRESGIPLLGNNSFGLVDRNTSLIEVKPVTGCNLSCVFCSVDEGPTGRWATDFIVEPGYLIEEFRKLAEYKCQGEGENRCSELEAHIGTNGEPLLYPKIIELVEGISSIEGVKRISFDTNGTLLTKKLIDELKDAGLTKIHLSLNAMDRKVAEKLAGCPYNLEHVLEMARYASKRLGLLIAPIWVPGINDDEMPKLIGFAKELGVRIAIQNFLSYKYGRNPAKQMDWERFGQKMGQLEKEHGVKLLFSEADFSIVKTRQLEKPFRKGQVIRAEVVCDGRLKGEKIAVAGERNISVERCDRKGSIKVRLTRDKHNIFFGVCA
jgi:uncharacterized Fe-S cluster-containing radical SAM superfamily enzyme